MSSRRGSYNAGGRSSLGYLFGSEVDPKATAPPAVSPLPPYGTDDDITTTTTSPSPKFHVSNNYRSTAQPANFITDRPSTKVKSVPGGDSSLGYLFGNK